MRLAVALVQWLPIAVDRSVVSRASGLQGRRQCLISHCQLRVRRLRGDLAPGRRPVTLQTTGSIHFLSPCWPARHRWLHLHVVRACVAQYLVCALHSIQRWIVLHQQRLRLLAGELWQLVSARVLIRSIVYSIMISGQQIVLAVYPVTQRTI